MPSFVPRSLTRSPGIALALLAAIVAGLAGTADAAAPPGRTAALAFAQAVNLVAADLPGYMAKKRTPVGGRGSFGPIPACAALKRSARMDVASRDSPDFNHADPSGGGAAQTVSSDVVVEASPGVAVHYLALVRGVGFRRCLALAFARSLKTHRPKGGSFRSPVVTAVSVSAPGADGTFAIHISVRLILDGLPVGGVYVHFLGFQLGPSLVTLFTVGGPSPFPATEEQRLFTLLVDRATAHRL